MGRTQTRRAITLTASVYWRIRRAADLRGVAMSTIIEQALGDLAGCDVQASVARARVAVRPKAGRPRKAPPIVAPRPRYAAVAPPREVRRYPSLERQLLGDEVANAMGCR